MNDHVLDSPPDASTGCVTVVEAADAGCVEAASSTPADLQPPAPPEAKIRPTTVREFERALRDLGFSQRESAAIARSGFKALDSADDTAELEQLAALLARNARILES